MNLSDRKTNDATHNVNVTQHHAHGRAHSYQGYQFVPN